MPVPRAVGTVPRVVGLLAARIVFAVTGLRPAGRVLVRGLGSGDETVRTVAGIFLVRVGRRARPLLEEAAERRQSLPLVLTVLGDLGDPACEPLLERHTSDPDPEAARSARDALRTLRAQRDGLRPPPL